jgi:alpha-D-ribose 1-methylphosphonate 5-phosphate C-P lyase
MDYLPSSAVIRNNDQVVTSGSTVYPRNLILGYVIDAGFNDTGVAVGIDAAHSRRAGIEMCNRTEAVFKGLNSLIIKSI